MQEHILMATGFAWWCSYACYYVPGAASTWPCVRATGNRTSPLYSNAAAHSDFCYIERASVHLVVNAQEAHVEALSNAAYEKMAAL
jgi:hypothetical protein